MGFGVVAGVWTRYSNDVLGGAILDHTVRMDDATGRRSVRSRPLPVLWWWMDDPARSREPRWAGSAYVGQRAADKGRGSAAGTLLPDAALQRRIRDEFERCA